MIREETTAISRFVGDVITSIEQTEKFIDKYLDVAVVDETIKSYELILKKIENLELRVQAEIELVNGGEIKNPHRTRNELFTTLQNLLALRIKLIEVLLKLRQRKDTLSNSINIQVNFKTQDKPETYLDVEIEEE